MNLITGLPGESPYVVKLQQWHFSLEKKFEFLNIYSLLGTARLKWEVKRGVLLHIRENSARIFKHETKHDFFPILKANRIYHSQ